MLEHGCLSWPSFQHVVKSDVFQRCSLKKVEQPEVFQCSLQKTLSCSMNFVQFDLEPASKQAWLRPAGADPPCRLPFTRSHCLENPQGKLVGKIRNRQAQLSLSKCNQISINLGHLSCFMSPQEENCKILKFTYN